MYSPSQVENLSGWTTNGLRDLRRKRFLDNYGEVNDAGRWRYSERDLVAFWLAAKLHQPQSGDGLDLATVFATAWTNAPTVLAFLRDRPAKRYSAIINHEKEVEGGLTIGGSEVVTLSDISELTRHEFFQAHLIDWKQLADAVPAKVREVIEDAD